MTNPKSQAWLDEYHRSIGGSQAGIVCGVSEYASAYELFERREGRMPWPEFDPKNLFARMGTYLEPMGLQLAEETLDVAITPHPQSEFVYNDKYPWAHALPDGWTNSGDSIVEVKWVHPSRFSKLRLHGLPSDWVAQGFHNLAVTKADRCLFAIGCTSTWEQLLPWLDRDEPVIENLMRLEKEFDDALKSGVNPYVIPPAPITETFEGGECVTLDDPIIREAGFALLEAKAMEEEAGEIVKDAKRRLADYMGEAPVAEIPGLLRVYNKMTPGRRTLPMKKALDRYPDLEDLVVTGEPFPTFKSYDLRRKGNR